MKTLFKIYEELYKAGVKVYSYNLCDTPAVTIEANKQYAIFFNPNAIHSLADETCIAYLSQINSRERASRVYMAT